MTDNVIPFVARDDLAARLAAEVEEALRHCGDLLSFAIHVHGEAGAFCSAMSSPKADPVGEVARAIAEFQQRQAEFMAEERA